jgi:Flp pilus assembly protein TadD
MNEPRRAPATTILVLSGLAAGVAFVYAPLLRCGFLDVFDDDLYVLQNAAVRAGLSLEGGRWALLSLHAANWHPLTWLSHMLDVTLFDLRAAGHHLTSVLLHFVNACLVFLYFRRTTGAPGRSALVAGLFALHPLRVESVAWISERKDVLCGTFWLLTMHAHAGYARSPGSLRYLTLLGTFTLGLLSKSMLVTLPFVLLALDFWPLNRAFVLPRDPDAGRRGALRRLLVSRPALEKTPLLLLAAGAGLLTLAAQWREGAVSSLASLPFGERAANALVSYGRYLLATAWPAKLAILYPFPPGGPPAWQVLSSVVCLAAVTALVVRGPGALPARVGWTWYLVALLPVLGLLQVGAQSHADRYTYLPGIGLGILVAWGVPTLLPVALRGGKALACVSALWLCVLAVVARGQAATWENSVTVFSRAVAVTPPNPVAENLLGKALYLAGDLPAAERHLRESVRLQPGFGEARNNLGIVLFARGNVAESILHLGEAVRLRPGYAEAHNNLGIALARQGSLAAAEASHRRALAIRPDSAAIRNNLGVALVRQGQRAEALRLFEEALRLDPAFPEARRNLADYFGREPGRPGTP